MTAQELWNALKAVATPKQSARLDKLARKAFGADATPYVGTGR